LPGRLYRLNVRFHPGRHSPELAELLDLLNDATTIQRGTILDQVASGGDLEAARSAAQPEAVETETLLEDLFGG
jgi:hypothetical protein